MPYSKVSELPAQTSKLSPKKKRQFMHVVNNALEGGNSEESAFKMAWASVKEVTTKGYVDDYSVMNRQLSQDEANYDPTAGDSEWMCAGCQWFVSPNSCVVVMGDISPTGVSDLYMDRVVYVQPPIPVTIVKENKGLVPTIKEFADSVLEKFGLVRDQRERESDPLPITLVKDKEGKTRFFVIYSNQFKDRDATILTEKSHREFETWADETGHYPELWFWHVKGTKLGQVDWLHYSSGMACASGYIDKEAEELVGGLDLGRLGVSHGFFTAATKEGVIQKYRSYELSLLPRVSSANTWTTVNLSKELDQMTFSPQKRESLLKLYGSEDVVNQFERDTDAMYEQLKAAGIEHKEVTEESTTDANQELLTVVKEFGAYAQAINKSVGELKERVEASEKSFDEKFSETWTAKVAELPKAFEASTSEKTVVTDKEAAEAKSKVSPDWLEEQLNKAYSGVVN